jgi:hypothetical protein
MVLDHHVLVFEVAGFVEAFTESRRKARESNGRPAVENPDHR